MIKIVKLLAKKHSDVLVENIQCFNFLVRIWLAKFLAKKNPDLLAKNIQNFSLTFYRLTKISKFLAKNNPEIYEKYSQNFNFGILNPNEIII